MLSTQIPNGRYAPLTVLRHRERVAVWTHLPSSVLLLGALPGVLNQPSITSATSDTRDCHPQTRKPLPARRARLVSITRRNTTVQASRPILLRPPPPGRYPTLTGPFSYQRSSQSGPPHSYQTYSDPSCTTRSTSCSTRPHFGHSGMRRDTGIRSSTGSKHVVLISCPLLGQPFAIARLVSSAEHFTPTSDRNPSGIPRIRPEQSPQRVSYTRGACSVVLNGAPPPLLNNSGGCA